MKNKGISAAAETIKNSMVKSEHYLVSVIKWILVSTACGTVCGIAGTAFHKCVEIATNLRIRNPWLIFFLPLGGLLIAFIYRKTEMTKNSGTNNVISSVRTSEYVPMRLGPVIFISTVLTHLFGGSAGREGAALQLGGSIGFQIGRLFKISEKDRHLLVICGMSGVFSALFGTPVTAAVFSIEVISVGVIYYSGFLPGLCSATVAYFISLLCGAAPTRFVLPVIPDLSVLNFLRVAVIGAAAALSGILFCIS